MAAGLLLKMVGFFIWALFWLGGSATVSTSAGAAFAGGGDAVVVVDARSAVAVTDEDFICATLDWWPPGKCDYGTCSWGLASLLNLVSSLSLSPTHKHTTGQERRDAGCYAIFPNFRL
jgi:heparanase